jgi:hypothetical protein
MYTNKEGNKLVGPLDALDAALTGGEGKGTPLLKDDTIAWSELKDSIDTIKDMTIDDT